MTETYSVAMVVDPMFGERLAALAARMPVWIVDSAVNRAWAEQHWREHPGQSHTSGVTIFLGAPSHTREAWCMDQLAAVDLHHGEYSHDPPYSVIEVYGVAPSAVLVKAFAEYGMNSITVTMDGFKATRAGSAV
jgi:hypothetical protein